MRLGEFFIQLGVLSDNKNLKEFASTIGDLTVDAALGIAALIGLEVELTKIAADAMNAAVGFEMFRSETGLSWQELQKWQIAGAQVNVSAESITSSVTQLQKTLAALRLGQGNRAPFQMLGIDVSGDAFTVLAQIRERIRGLDKGTASNLLGQMGLSPEMLRILELSNTEFNKLAGTIHGMTTAQEREFYRAKETLITWGLVAKQYGIDVVYTLILAFDRWMGYLAKAHEYLKALIPIILAVAAAFFPVTAAIGGLLLLLDDLAVYLSGGDSLIGRAMKALPKLGEEIKKAFDLGNISKILDLLHPAGYGPVGAAVAAGIGGAQSMINTFHINVTGFTNPVGAGEEISKVIARHLTQSSKQINNQGH